MNTNSVRLFYVEGETELHLLKKLELRGKLKKFNFWNNNVNKIIRTIKSNYCVCIVYDTEDIHPQNVNLSIIASWRKNSTTEFPIEINKMSKYLCMKG